MVLKPTTKDSVAHSIYLPLTLKGATFTKTPGAKSSLAGGSMSTPRRLGTTRMRPLPKTAKKERNSGRNQKRENSASKNSLQNVGDKMTSGISPSFLPNGILQFGHLGSYETKKAKKSSSVPKKKLRRLCRKKRSCLGCKKRSGLGGEQRRRLTRQTPGKSRRSQTFR